MSLFTIFAWLNIICGWISIYATIKDYRKMDVSFTALALIWSVAVVMVEIAEHDGGTAIFWAIIMILWMKNLKSAINRYFEEY